MRATRAVSCVPQRDRASRWPDVCVQKVPPADEIGRVRRSRTRSFHRRRVIFRARRWRVRPAGGNGRGCRGSKVATVESVGRAARRGVRLQTDRRGGPMKPLPHDYEVTLTAASVGYATVAATGLPDLTTAPPAEYEGPGDAWSPEHLLLASVSTCFLFTFRAVAKASHVEFVEVEANAAGAVDRTGGVTRFTDIVVRPTVITPSGADAAAVRRAIDKAASRCLVSSSLVTPV